jgi:Zn finger protein HypA/HybF involved in hydrogenase expression
MKLTIESVKADVESISKGDLTVLSDEYIGNKAKLDVRCNVCHFLFRMNSNNLKNDHGCPKCVNLAQPTMDELKMDVDRISKGALRVVGGEYVNSKTNVDVQCTVCEGMFSARPNSLKSGTGCPLCVASESELLITRILESQGIEFVPEYRFRDCKYKKPLPFDFYLPEFHACIEYDGEHHLYKCNKNGSPNPTIEIRDQIKTDYCESNDIPLLRIPFWHKDRIEQFVTLFVEGLKFSV